MEESGGRNFRSPSPSSPPRSKVLRVHEITNSDGRVVSHAVPAPRLSIVSGRLLGAVELLPSRGNPWVARFTVISWSLDTTWVDKSKSIYPVLNRQGACCSLTAIHSASSQNGKFGDCASCRYMRSQAHHEDKKRGSTTTLWFPCV